jgi:hypothetical protein
MYCCTKGSLAVRGALRSSVKVRTAPLSMGMLHTILHSFISQMGAASSSRELSK